MWTARGDAGGASPQAAFAGLPAVAVGVLVLSSASYTPGMISATRLASRGNRCALLAREDCRTAPHTSAGTGTPARPAGAGATCTCLGDLRRYARGTGCGICCRRSGSTTVSIPILEQHDSGGSPTPPFKLHVGLATLEKTA